MKFDTLKIIPEQKPELPDWANPALVFSFAFLLVVGIVFLLLNWQAAALSSKKEKLTRQITELESQTGNKTLEGQVFEIANKIDDLSRLIKEHKINSRFFDFLRATCHPEVQFTGFNLDGRTNSVQLSGKTENFQILGEQIRVLIENENASNLEISNISFDENGKIVFQIRFLLKENLLKN